MALASDVECEIGTLVRSVSKNIIFEKVTSVLYIHETEGIYRWQEMHTMWEEMVC